jgi:hypothetical protein
MSGKIRLVRVTSAMPSVMILREGQDPPPSGDFEVPSDVSGVPSDVSGVSSDVSGVSSDVSPGRLSR